MATKRMENWDAADFSQSFRSMAAVSPNQTFREKFHSLADALEPMDREFVKSSAYCGHRLASAMEDVHAVAAQIGFCARPEGFGEACEVLYGKVDEVVSRIESLRETCLL